MSDRVTPSDIATVIGLSQSRQHGYGVFVRLGANPAEHLTPTQARALAGRYAEARNAILRHLAVALDRSAADAEARNAAPTVGPS